PSLARRLLRSEVVTFGPSTRRVMWIVAVECVEANPQLRLMGRAHKPLQTRLVLRRPGPGLLLPANLDHAPGVVPPAVIVGPNAGNACVARERPGGTKHEQRAADRHLVVEHLALRV